MANTTPKFGQLSEKLNLTNYLTWKEEIYSELFMYNLQKFIEEEVETPTDATELATFNKEKRWVEALIRKNVSLELIDLVTTSSGDPWTIMQNLGQTCLNSSTEGINMLRSKLYSLKFRDFPDAQTFVNEFRKLCNDLTNQGITHDEENKKVLLLNALPPSFDTFTLMIKNNVNITFPQLCFQLIQYSEKTITSPRNRSHDSALMSKKFLNKIKCHNCGLRGHLARFCKKPPSNNKNIQHQSFNKNQSNKSKYAKTVQDCSESDSSVDENDIVELCNYESDQEQSSESECKTEDLAYVVKTTSTLILDSGSS